MATLTWVAAAAGLASDGLNWSGGVAPMAGDVVVFDSTSINNCSWDLDALAVTVHSLTLATGYTGEVTQGDVDIGIGVGGLTIEYGVLGPNSAREIICSGPVTNSKGMSGITINVANFRLTGVGMVFAPTGYIRDLTITEGASIIAPKPFDTSTNGVRVTVNGELILKSSFSHYANTIVTVGPNGSISGDGNMRFYHKTQTVSIYNNGMITADILFSSATTSSSITFSPGADLITQGKISAFSGHPTNTVMLDLNGHSLTAASVTVGTRGNILWGEGTHRIGSLDTSAGGSDFESSQVIMTGGSIALGAGQTFHDLITLAEAVTLQSDVAVNNMLAHVGPIERGAYSLTLADPTKEYTGLRRPLVRPLVLARIEDPICRPLLEGIIRA